MSSAYTPMSPGPHPPGGYPPYASHPPAYPPQTPPGYLSPARGAKTRRVPLVIHLIGLAMFAFFLLGVWGLATRILRRQFPMDPLVFFLTWVFTIPWTRSRSGFGYLHFGMFFVATFAAMGFVGTPAPMTKYELLQNLFKPWISLVGIPWIVLNTSTNRTAIRFVQVAAMIAAAGAVLSCLQVAMPGAFPEGLVSQAGRGAGFWANPNRAGLNLVLMIFLFLAYPPFDHRPLNNALTLLMIAGTIATLSRGALIAGVIGTVVFTTLTGRLRILIKVVLAGIVAAALAYFTLRLAEDLSASLTQRIESIERLFTGQTEDFEEIEEGSSGRLALWQISLQAVGSQWGVGLGHGRMDRIVQIGPGLGPHNYYIFLLGNSGILALLAFLALLAWLFVLTLSVPDRESRAALMATLIALCALNMVGHTFLDSVSCGSIMGLHILVLTTARSPGFAPRGRRATITVSGARS